MHNIQKKLSLLHRHYIRYAVLGIAILCVVLGTIGWAQEYPPAPQDDGYNVKSYEEGSKVRFQPIKVNIHPKPIASDPSVKYDYDIVFIRAPRLGDDQQTSWPDVSAPNKVEPGADMLVLHPDGREELLFKAGPRQAVTDLFVSFDAKWVFFALFDGIQREPSGEAFAQSSDIYKLNVKTRQVVRLTHQEFTPNTGIIETGYKPSGVFNIGPCPLPGGRVMFTSDRNNFVASKNAGHAADLKTHDFQLFSMDDDGSNVDTVGHLNLNSALHPVILRDGRVMFSTFESEGFHDFRSWGMWTINPDGTHWLPLFSALSASSENARHFSTQLSDGHIIFEEYYFSSNLGFGTYLKVPESVPPGEPYFASASGSDPRNYDNVKLGAIAGRSPFTPLGMQEITTFSHSVNMEAYPSDPKDPNSPRDGKVTQPAGAPDNNLLTVYSSGPTYGFSSGDRVHGFIPPAIHSGIYMIKGGQQITEPGQLLFIKVDPNYNLQWPRALVPYKRIYGIDEPATLSSPGYDRTLAKELPEGTPYGIVGSASVYKRESYPGGKLNPGEVTAHYGGGQDPFLNLGGLTGGTRNWGIQGADDGKYDNSDVHAIRILVEEPTTNPDTTSEKTRKWWNATNERFRILGEIPVRKFNGDKQPIDPDGNPDTSFMVKIPANVPWTFQMLDKNGMVLNMAQTWHQIRPGEVRTDCGGCHAHSQKATPWKQTAAAKSDYKVFDLTQHTSLITTKKYDESHQKWDVKDETGLRFQKNVEDVEYYRDIKPIFERSCVACHTQKSAKPAANLVLDDDKIAGHNFFGRASYQVPNTFALLAMHQGTGIRQGSRYIRYFESRRSLMVWKIYGQRLDGFSNDDFAYETKPGDPTSLQYKGKPITKSDLGSMDKAGPSMSIAYLGRQMPPPEAVAGTYKAPDGEIIKVPALSDEDRLTIVRWIDMGCPIDLDYDPAHPKAHGHGWLADEVRPTLTVDTPVPDANQKLSRIVIGMNDFDSGLDLSSFQVVADFNLEGAKAGTNLAARFKPTSPGVWEMTLTKPVTELSKGHLTVSVKDEQGNVSQIQRTFSVKPKPSNRSTSALNAPSVPTHTASEINLQGNQGLTNPE